LEKGRDRAEEHDVDEDAEEESVVARIRPLTDLETDRTCRETDCGAQTECDSQVRRS
jgi:hypothetical protein